jgi:hypothetical protein
LPFSATSALLTVRIFELRGGSVRPSTPFCPVVLCDLCALCASAVKAVAVVLLRLAAVRLSGDSLAVALSLPCRLRAVDGRLSSMGRGRIPALAAVALAAFLAPLLAADDAMDSMAAKPPARVVHDAA